MIYSVLLTMLDYFLLFGYLGFVSCKNFNCSNPKHSLFLEDLIYGLKSGNHKDSKFIPSKWHYDTRGSEIYERITDLPSYYLKRTEKELLLNISSNEIAILIEDKSALIEFGSGSSEKTKILLYEIPNIRFYFPIDISHHAVVQASETISNLFPDRYVEPIVADFTKPLILPAVIANSSDIKRIGWLAGSTVGNLKETELIEFFRTVRDLLGPNAIFITGFDLIKDIEVLISCYTGDLHATFNRLETDRTMSLMGLGTLERSAKRILYY